MSAAEQFKKMRALEAEAAAWARLCRERDEWKGMAIGFLLLAVAAVFLLLCFGIGQLISGG